MGCCCSLDSLPPIPKVIEEPPATYAPSVKFSVVRLGRWRGRDYGVWKDFHGNQDNMWFWINKSDGPKRGTGIIDVEDFNRMDSEGKKTNKGQVFWRAMINEQPHFDQFQRPAIMPFVAFPGKSAPINHSASAIRHRYQGIKPTDGYTSESDEYYVRQLEDKKKDNNFPCKGEHTGQNLGDKVEDLGHPVISKWRLHTAAMVKDGNLGRGNNMMIGQEPMLLEVFSKGSGATIWQKWDSWREVPDGTPEEGQEQKFRVDHTTGVSKIEKEWVDRIEFRLSFRGKMIGQSWVVAGNSGGGPGDLVIENDFFHTNIKGSILQKSSVETTTKMSGIDPILALLLSHLCTTEFSIAEILNDLHLKTPANPPPAASTHPHPSPQNLNYVPASGPIEGAHTWM